MQWVVVFKGARDSYQIPLALAEVGRLEALVTDWYSPLDRPWLRQLAERFPRLGSALRKRYCDGLPSASVRVMPLELIRSKVSSRAGSEHGDNRIGAVAGSLARARRAGILSCSYYGYAAFRQYGDGPAPKVLFQLHPHPSSIRSLFSEEMRLAPECRESLSGELEMSMPEHRFRQLCEEAALADLIMTPSSYVKQTLAEHGVAEHRVRVVPHGVRLDLFWPPAEPPRGPFRVVFAGQMVQRKGLGYLLEAWRRLALRDAELVLVGRGLMDNALLARYDGVYTLRAGVTRDELRAIYQSSDLCCVPSLAEGFGLVYLEALACGTPVIGTPNTGAADLITEGGEGFIVPIRDVEALSDRIRWCYGHRGALREMRPRARQLAEKHPPERFRQILAETVSQLGTSAEARGSAGGEGTLA